MNTNLLVSAPALRLEDAIPTGDPAAFARLRRWGGMELVHDLVHLFEQLAPQRLQVVRYAVAAEAAPEAEAAAHALGSSAGQLGAVRLQRLCRHVEMLCAHGDVAAARPVAAEMEEEYARYRAWLARELAALEQGPVVMEQVA